MKKLFAILLAAVMLLSLAACGYINEAEVSVLWSGDGKVEYPNTLINAMERAMYIESISYKHYGANGESSQQIKQAEDCLKAGCAALAVELVNASDAKTIVDMAKEKNVPVVFFNCSVSDDVIASYDKCALVDSDVDSVEKVANKQLSDIYKDKKSIEKLDRNGDGKLSYITLGNVSKIENKFLTKVSVDLRSLKVKDAEKDYKKLVNDKDEVVEMIITSSDVIAAAALVYLQEELDFNTNKLATHFVPIYTVGTDMDYKSLVMLEMPEPPIAYEKWETAEAQKKLSKEDTKKLDKWWKEDKDVAEWKEEFANLCNLATVEWKDLGAYLYTTAEVIGAGRLSGAVVEDLDAVAGGVAVVLRNLIKGNDIAKDIAKDNVKGDRKILIPYTVA